MSVKEGGEEEGCREVKSWWAVVREGLGSLSIC